MFVLSVHCATACALTTNELHAQALGTFENVGGLVADCGLWRTDLSTPLLLLSLELALFVHVYEPLASSFALIQLLIVRARTASARVVHLIEGFHHDLGGRISLAR